MKLLRSLLAASVLSAVSLPAAAQLNPNATTSSDQLQLVSSGPYSPFGTYTGRLLQSPGQPIIDFWCVDFSHSFLNNLNVDVTRFDASAADFDARTRFGFASLDNYKKAAYLTQFFNGLTVASSVQDLHFAIWHVLNPGQPNTNRPGEAFWLAKVSGGNTEYQAINTKYWFVLSDPGMIPGSPFQRNGGQEHITEIVPEPSAILLLSTGLLGIVGLARIRRRGKKQD